MICDLKSFNDASEQDARTWFREQVLESNVCDAWIDQILSQRPFDLAEIFLETAETAWRGGLSESQHVVMMNGHPEIGRTEATSGDPNGMEAAEQRGMSDCPPALAAQIDADKAVYRQRFGFIYMIFATGLSSDELARALQERLANTREEELETATTEFWRINRKRLMDKLGFMDSVGKEAYI
mmetsp:Transcript_5065/g.9682  ORF Transcript_5065/g.9682 Transcript_5065/m.9682 type:complete len:183 (-) Transcript_5065:50-598(-)